MANKHWKYKKSPILNKYVCRPGLSVDNFCLEDIDKPRLLGFTNHGDNKANNEDNSRKETLQDTYDTLAIVSAQYLMA